MERRHIFHDTEFVGKCDCTHCGLVITYVLCVELISMVTEKNNMHDIDTFMFFKWFFKAWVAVYLVTHTFTITMAVFDMAQHVVSRRSGRDRRQYEYRR